MYFPSPASSLNYKNHVLVGFIADLELEVDRLRRQAQLVQYSACEAVAKIGALCDAITPDKTAIDGNAVNAIAEGLADVLRDAREMPGYHPAHDQVVAIAVRPLIEQVFRWQQRLHGVPHAVLRLDLKIEHLEWFPARLRHILDNLIAHALQTRDPSVGEVRVTFVLASSPRNYELRMSDNGLGISSDRRAEMVDLLYRSAPVRAAGFGVGLAVVKLLVEESGGELVVVSGEPGGTCFTATLPRYDIHDFLN